MGPRIVKGADIGEHERRLHEQHDAERDDQQRTSRESPFLSLARAWIGRAVNANTVLQASLSHGSPPIAS